MVQGPTTWEMSNLILSPPGLLNQNVRFNSIPRCFMCVYLLKFEKHRSFRTFAVKRRLLLFLSFFQRAKNNGHHDCVPALCQLLVSGLPVPSSSLCEGGPPSPVKKWRQGELSPQPRSKERGPRWDSSSSLFARTLCTTSKRHGPPGFYLSRRRQKWKK